jgi:hypothetical protein
MASWLPSRCSASRRFFKSQTILVIHLRELSSSRLTKVYADVGVNVDDMSTELRPLTAMGRSEPAPDCCPCCLEPKRLDELWCLACCHAICKPCWSQLASLAITKVPGFHSEVVCSPSQHCVPFVVTPCVQLGVSCIGMKCPECPAVIPQSIVQNLVSPADFSAYKRFQVMFYVMCHRVNLKPCPRPGCNLYVVAVEV